MWASKGTSSGPTLMLATPALNILRNGSEQVAINCNGELTALIDPVPY